MLPGTWGQGRGGGLSHGAAPGGPWEWKAGVKLNMTALGPHWLCLGRGRSSGGDNGYSCTQNTALTIWYKQHNLEMYGLM